MKSITRRMDRLDRARAALIRANDELAEAQRGHSRDRRYSAHQRVKEATREMLAAQNEVWPGRGHFPRAA